MCKLLIKILILTTVICFAGIGYAQTNAEDHAKLAYEFWAQENLTNDDMAMAVYHMNEAVNLQPEEYKWTYNLAVFYYNLSDWEKAKEFFGKAIGIAVTSIDSIDAENWLANSRIQHHKDRILASADDGDEIGIRELDYMKISMKEYSIMKDQLFENEEPVLPIVPTSNSEKAITNFFQEKLPDYNYIKRDVFIVIGACDEEKLQHHYDYGIKDFYNFFRKEYFTKSVENYITVMVSESPDELIDAMRIINPKVRLNVYAPFVGFYLPSDNMIVATVGGGYGTLLHEMIHALITNENMETPRWCEEAMASLYERSVWKDGRLTPLVNWRMSFLHSSVIPLSKMDEVIQGNHINPNKFAFLRLLLLFLDKEYKVADFFKSVSHKGDDFSISKTLEKLGDNFTQEKWVEFVKNAHKEYDLELRLTSGIPSYGELKIVQQALNKILGKSLKVDGYWGTNTTDAVKEFQAKYGLSKTGRCNQKTLDMIDKKYRDLALKKE